MHAYIKAFIPWYFQDSFKKHGNVLSCTAKGDDRSFAVTVFKYCYLQLMLNYSFENITASIELHKISYIAQ